MDRISALAMVAAGALLLAGSAVAPRPASAFDAGGFALQQHQHGLQRQQSGVDRDRPAGKPSPELQRQMQAELEQIMEQHKQQLRPEYDRRVQEFGREAADEWLSGKAERLGQQAAQQVLRKYQAQ